jgi:hypothetical protein
MAMKITSNISRLLGSMLGLVGGKAGQGLAKKSGKGKSGKLAKGETLGNDLLLSGLGFSKSDKGKAKSHKVEKQNVERFLKDPKSELGQLKSRQNIRQAAKKNQAKAAEAQRPNENADQSVRESRKDEGMNEARVVGQEQGEAKEFKERVEAKEAHLLHRDERDKEEEGRGAGGWVLEDADSDDDERKRGGEAQVFSDAERCHGHSEDGGRCLRKSQENSPFCIVHR